MTNLKSDIGIQRYLGSVETSINLSDVAAQKKLDDGAALAIDRIAKAQGYLDAESHKQVDLLRAAIDELRVQYALGKMEGSEKLEAIEDRIEHGYRNLKNALRRTKKLTAYEAEELNDNLHEGWRHLKLEINLLYLRLGLVHDSGSERLALAKEALIEDAKLIARLGKEEADLVGKNFSLWCRNLKKSLRKSALKLVHSMEKYLVDSES
ncbi:hypothetical protein N9195_02220 [bacterium]|nr:hypothetical protein [bacterium]